MQFLSDGRKRGARASVANSNRGALLMAAELLFLKSVAILACNVTSVNSKFLTMPSLLGIEPYYASLRLFAPSNAPRNS